MTAGLVKPFSMNVEYGGGTYAANATRIYQRIQPSCWQGLGSRLPARRFGRRVTKYPAQGALDFLAIIEFGNAAMGYLAKRSKLKNR